MSRLRIRDREVVDVDLFRKTFAEINFQSLRENTRYLRSLNPNNFFCPMIKANAYGHGIAAVARVLDQENISGLGVALVEEALQARRAGAKKPIYLFGPFDKDAVSVLIQNNIIPVISTFEQLDAMKSVAGHAWKLHLKLDTGMHRLGFSPLDAENALKVMPANWSLEGICTHLHLADSMGKIQSSAWLQLAVLEEFVRKHGFEKLQNHAYNSSGLLHFSESKAGLPKWGSRPGLTIYGYTSSEHKVPLKPVMSLRTRISKVQTLTKGEGTSYGWTWIAEKESIIAVLPIGYGDGYHRLASNRSHVLFRGEKIPVRGTVCMDYIMIEVTHQHKQKPVSVGEEVTLFGVDSAKNLLSANELAQNCETIPWEILTSVTERVPRVGLNE